MIQTVRILAHTLTIIAALSKESMKDPPEPMHLGRDEQPVLAAKIARILVPKRACSSTTTFCAFSRSNHYVYHVGFLLPLPPTDFVAR